jgi:hypothetical protein
MDLKTLQDSPPWEWPRGAGKTLLAVLHDTHADPGARLLAAEFAGELVVMNDALADALLAIVGDFAEPEELRAKAAISLGPALEEAEAEGFDDPDAVSILEMTFHRIQQSLRRVHLEPGAPELVRRRALEASVRFPQEWHAAAIASAWASQDPEWKLTAVFCMRYVPGFDQQILEALESADDGIHFEAVCAAGAREVDAAWSHVAALASSVVTEKFLLLAAIEALATIRPHDSMEIFARLADSEDEDIRETAREAIDMAQGMPDGDDKEDAGDDDEV